MAAIRHVCGVMVTATTYGTWLRGDARGWVQDGSVFPPNPILENHDQRLLKHAPFLFDERQLYAIGEMIGDSLCQRLQQRVMAMTVQMWHVHFIVAESATPVASVVKCAKDAVRYGLRADRPIWTDHYDKRFCFDVRSLHNRIEYVERHNIERGWPARPWPFIVAREEIE